MTLEDGKQPLSDRYLRCGVTANRSAVACCTPGRTARTTELHAVLNAIFYLLRTGCQWRLLPREYPVWGTAYQLFPHMEKRRRLGAFATYSLRRLREAMGRSACPSVVSMDGQSIKTTERGGVRGFDGRKRVKGRKRHILVGTLGMLIATNMSDRVAGTQLLSGLRPLCPRIRTVIADAGHQSRKLARQLLRDEGWELRIVKRNQRDFQITGLTWIVERTFAWLGRNRRLSKDYEYCVQTSEAMIDIATIRLMINRLSTV